MGAIVRLAWSLACICGRDSCAEGYFCHAERDGCLDDSDCARAEPERVRSGRTPIFLPSVHPATLSLA